ncbi:bifunctional adenosylcobinamide kinase/adenosylcobinamide-phosphate guanylyltransferase [Senegalia massiliensis]|uniref:Adenosylcobinamide kinase n=1 Tax=Senegalia massiliensis TaxID=1720316 RepID=A0A845QZ73_9CLOT|nr:bifunctional adenosylcobinamide kinase/adenosylcobinamide-phosphate guanylyltransferase [Senegalia massiliensis]NBI06488.1 bifunctional adenosylcobinamide kinase/adenosylcobinamide-phosphate guanylyltransferase [Senegalia massiliensis]
MGDLTLVTGGARSGKSSFAEKIVKKNGKNVVYIATSIPFDEGMKSRIKKHRKQRPESWHTIEMYKNFNIILDDDKFKYADTIILDCITIMISNLILEKNIDFDDISEEEIDTLENQIFNEIYILLDALKDKNVVLVTNELGMGIVPSYKLGSIFRDIAGRVNQYIAKRANKVYLTVSGIPIEIKGEK